MLAAPDVLILADDLSGAADCATACVNAGLDAEVCLGQLAGRSTRRVVSIDADTRALPMQQAAQRMHNLASHWLREHRPILFKKVDSTLRGHLGAEIAAVLGVMRAATPDAVAILAPAFPANGRVTLEGMHRLHGRPLHQTEMWTREQMRGEAHLPRMLEDEGLRCRHLSLEQVHHGSISVAVDLRGTDVIVCDAVEEGDLAAVAKIAAGLGDRALWVGSAGLAFHLPRAAGLTRTQFVRPPLPKPSGPVLIVLGSAAQRTREQAAVLQSQTNVRTIVCTLDVLLSGLGDREWKACSDELFASLAGGHDVLLMSAPDPIVEHDRRKELSLALAHMAENVRDHVGTLIASGGETARNVLDRWGVQVLRLHGELEAGVPVSQVSSPEARALTVVTKAGDFGHSETLLNCWRWTQRSRSEER